MKLGGKYRSVFPTFRVDIFLTLEIKQTLWIKTETRYYLTRETFCYGREVKQGEAANT